MKVLLLGNGELSSKEIDLIHELRRDLEFKIAVIDGGYHHLNKLKLKEDYHLGDFDSSSSQENSIQLEDQSLTDLEKSIIELGFRGFNEFHLFAFHGKRFDHALNNLEITFRLSRNSSIYFYTEDFKIYVAKNFFSMNCEKNKVVSIFTFTNCQFDSSKGLKYPLHGLQFSCGEKTQGISNLTTANLVEIKFSHGEALIFIEH